MGSSSSKFRKHLQNGDEYAALHLFNNNSDLRKAIDPNLSYGDNHNHDTPLHLASRHGMKSLMRIFLFEHGGNPNKKNGRDETALHNLCMTSQGNNFVVQQRRSECLMLFIQWRGATLGDGEVEKVDLGSQDEKDNTALHYAAASGLKRCVELLVSHNAPLFTENKQKQTPCDCAEKNGQNEIALYLESKMVFSGEEENPDDLEMENILDQMESEEAYSGLRAQDLQEAKDQLLVETSDMLRVPLFTAEALLRNHEWSREALLEAWMDNPVACCEKCGVVPPVTVCGNHPAVTLTEDNVHRVDDHDLVTPVSPGATHEDEVICDICTCFINQSDEPVSMTCHHVFCRGCWERYLTGKIKEGDAHNITCPGYSCSKLVPVDVIETIVSRDMARRYLQFDIKAFVDSNPSIKWCPYPGCGRAVRLPESENPLSPSFRGIMDPNMTKDFSHAVDCGNGHIFCWECMGEAHEPASCENWQKWHQKIGEIKPEELNGTEEETEMAANCLWLVTNSKPCPNCKSPIQKNEGCNHMKCSKCKHDFCWVCLEQWKRHSSSTGGYFRCNRYEVVKKVVETSESTKSDAEEKNKKMQELNRFVHYYTRFKNHENSFKFEEPLLTTAKEKMMVLAKAVTDPDTANTETKFVEDAVQQLLKGRRVLKCSYVYGYYLQETGYKKPIFEFMQTELEECTEALSEMIARPYLRTPRSKIIQTAHLVQRKRQEFVTAISKGLVPPDTSPSAKRKKGRYKLELDEDLKKALMASLSNIDPSNPWVKDPSGKHTNVSALLDWPEEEDESDTEAEVSSISAAVEDGLNSPSESEVAGGMAKCSRENCSKPRAQNPRTGEVHDHCSIKCMQFDKGGMKTDEKEDKIEEGITDYHMDLLRALEMSRLQFLREMGQLRPGSTSSESHSPITPRTPRSPNLSVTSTSDVQASMNQPGPSGTTSTVEVNLHNDLPPVRRGRVKSEPGERLEGKVKAGRVDVELERALEMSRLSLNDEERDLRLAIELSLKDSLGNPKLQSKVTPTPPIDPSMSSSDPALSPMKNQSKSDEKIHFSSRNPDYSSIVARVPNRSVEDLAQEGVDSPLENLGACGGLASPKQRSPKFKQILDPSVTSSGSGGQKANPFGVIKDISVTNINVGDIDKTKAFEDKKLDTFLSSSSSKEAFTPQQQHIDLSLSSDDGNMPPSNLILKQKNGIMASSAKQHSISRESAFSYSDRSGASSSSSSSTFKTNLIKDPKCAISSSSGGDLKSSSSSGSSSSCSSRVVSSAKVNNNSKVSNIEQAGSCSYLKKDHKSIGFDDKIKNVSCFDNSGSRYSSVNSAKNNADVNFEKNDLRTPVVRSKNSVNTIKNTEKSSLVDQSQIMVDTGNKTRVILDPDDLHIDSVMLESMIQGVDDYSTSSSSSSSNINNNRHEQNATKPVETNLDNLVDQYSDTAVPEVLTTEQSPLLAPPHPNNSGGLNRDIVIRTDHQTGSGVVDEHLNIGGSGHNNNYRNNHDNNSSLSPEGEDDINDAVFV